LTGGAIISATPGLRTSSLAMFMGLVVIIVIGGGPPPVGAAVHTREGSGPTPQAPGQNPDRTGARRGHAGRPHHTSGLPATARRVEFDFSGAVGHTMQFRKIDVKGFPIGSVGGGTPTKGAVDLKPGTYDIYCTIDGHAQQGMVATITVTAAAS